MILRTLGTAALFVCGACSDANSTHHLKHVWGETSRPLAPSTRPCAAAAPEGAADGYLRSLFNIIVAANSQTFSNEYIPERFCLSVDSSSEIFAKTRAENMDVRFSRGLLQAAESDAEVAMVLAHELAHVLRQHLEWQGLPEVVTGNPEWLHEKELADSAHARLDVLNYATNFARLAELERLLAEHPNDESLRSEWERLKQWEANEKLLTQEWHAHLARLENLADALLGGPGSSRNWSEAEADEVGFELALRAGFEPAAFKRIMASTHPEEGLGACLAAVDAHRPEAPMAEPVRGTGNHPSPCWRVYNVEIGERQGNHSREYAALEAAAQQQHGGFLINPVGTLAEVLRSFPR